MVNSEQTILDFLVVIFYLLMFAFMYGVKFSLMSAFNLQLYMKTKVLLITPKLKKEKKRKLQSLK